jgi:hypothetical protein
MSKTRNLSDLLDANGDVKTEALDNATLTGIDDNADATAITIDSSENVLVGKTSTALGTAGQAFLSSGVSFFTRDGDKVLRVNRLTSDGDIIDLLKDGTTVGTIGNYSTAIYFGQGDTTVMVDQTNNQFTPRGTNGAQRSDTINLGSAGSKWKDFYLSGNIYLGGTGSANALDDYEEGTFTPTFGGSTTDPTVSWNVQSGHYTKIGNIVHFNLTFYPSAISGGSGNLNIRGLPFTNRNHRAPASIIFDRVRILSSSTGIHPATVAAEVEQNTTYMAITAMNDAADEVRTFVQVSDLEAAPSDNPYIVITGTYTTD